VSNSVYSPDAVVVVRCMQRPNDRESNIGRLHGAARGQGNCLVLCFQMTYVESVCDLFSSYERSASSNKFLMIDLDFICHICMSSVSFYTVWLQCFNSVLDSPFLDVF